MDVFKGRLLICRTCGSESPETTPISSSQRYQNVDIIIREVIMKCASVQVHESDGLPVQVCNKCMEELSRAFIFKTLCEETDAKLRKTFSQNGGLNHHSQSEIEKSSLQKEFLDVSNTIESEEEPDDAVQKNDAISDINNFDGDSKGVLKAEKVVINSFTRSPHTCKECNITYDGLASYQVHLETKHGGLIEYFTSNKIMLAEVNLKKYSDVTKVVSTEDENNISKINTNNSTKRLFICNDCGSSFNSAMDLQIHDRIHTKRMPFKCNICSKRFTMNRHLEVHEKVHTPESPCKSTTTTSRLLEVYLNQPTLVPSDVHPYQCKVCNIGFAFIHKLVAHKLEHDATKRQFDNTDVPITRKLKLSKCKRVLNGKRRHKCDVCNLNFKKKAGLNLHMLVHINKSYKCKVCNSKFAQRKKLNHHLRVHAHKP